MHKQQKPNKGTSDLLRYAGWGTQLFVLLALAVFGGGKLDQWAGFTVPLLVWVLPFAVLVIMIYQLIRDTSKKQKSKE
jgi:chromate transport protein ChrA